VSRKDEKEHQDRAIKEAVAFVRREIQSSYAAGVSTREALKAGTMAAVAMAQKYPKYESTIMYFCEQEKTRLGEAMQATDRSHDHRSALEVAWRAEREKATVAKKAKKAMKVTQ